MKLAIPQPHVERRIAHALTIGDIAIATASVLRGMVLSSPEAVLRYLTEQRARRTP